MEERKQIKSKKRVADHGEVFTSEREVNAMLDLVKDETERIDSRFLEPACGTGNFLVEILRRKLNLVKKKYKKGQMEFEKYSILAVSSVYGVDLLQDNVLACQDRLYDIWNNLYMEICNNDLNEDCRKTIRYILNRNILCGNALTLKKVDGHGNDLPEPIVFSEWSFITGHMLQRSDYRFDKLLEGNEEKRNLFEDSDDIEDNSGEQLNLYITESPSNQSKSTEGEFLKKLIKHYRRIWEDGQ